MTNSTSRKNRQIGKLTLFAAAFAILFSGLGGLEKAHASSKHSNIATGKVAEWLNPDRRQLSKGELRQNRRAAYALNRKYGNGSYICSASGFGQRSKCFAR